MLGVIKLKCIYSITYEKFDKQIVMSGNKVVFYFTSSNMRGIPNFQHLARFDIESIAEKINLLHCFSSFFK
jgi:hypothetical protein